MSTDEVSPSKRMWVVQRESKNGEIRGTVYIGVPNLPRLKQALGYLMEGSPHGLATSQLKALRDGMGFSNSNGERFTVNRVTEGQIVYTKNIN